MISWKITEFKGGFFDRLQVRSRMDKVTKKVLSRFGAYVRTRAKRSMRYRKKFDAHSEPGKPPFAHLKLLRDRIYFAYDASRKTVIIGPAKLNKRGRVPRILEYGGLAYVDDWELQHGKVVRIKRLAKFPARPYMRPAFAEELKKLPQMWQGAFNKGG